MIQGSLTFVGTGLTVAGQVTQEALSCDRRCREALLSRIERRRPAAGSSRSTIRRNRSHDATARANRASRPTRRWSIAFSRRCATASVVAAFYGHPGIFVTPSHEAIRRARAEGYEARCSRESRQRTASSPTWGSIPASAAARVSKRPTSCCAGASSIRPALSSSGRSAASEYSTFHSRPLWSRQGLEGPRTRAAGELPGQAHEVVVYEAVPYPTLPPKILRVPSRSWPIPTSAFAPRSASRRSRIARATSRCDGPSGLLRGRREAAHRPSPRPPRRTHSPRRHCQPID
jgi:uroporphyrin-III C-methyltransferase